ncbi:MAG: phosphatase PAP2 family protein [Ilumatobacteraceae bacterium]
MTVAPEVETRPASDEPTAARPPRYGWLRETAIVLGFYYVYQTIRSLADHGITSRAYRNARLLVQWERNLWIFHEQTIQQAFLGSYWFIRVMNVYYGTLHFVITVGLLIWMYRKRHAGYTKMRNLLGLTTALALIGYWAFPLAPPRLYKCNDNIPVPGPDGFTIGRCFVDTLDKVGGLWSYHSPVAKAVANQYAAMPSLHFAWSVWCGIVLFRYGNHRVARALGILYPALTLFAIVVTANHYFLDAVGGAIVIGAAAWILGAIDRRRAARAATAAPLVTA